jgi:hypothetical protein
MTCLTGQKMNCLKIFSAVQVSMGRFFKEYPSGSQIAQRAA